MTAFCDGLQPGTCGRGGSRSTRGTPRPRNRRPPRTPCTGAPARRPWMDSVRAPGASDRIRRSRGRLSTPRIWGSPPPREPRCCERPEGAPDGHRRHPGVTADPFGIPSRRRCGPACTRHDRRHRSQRSRVAPKARNSPPQGTAGSYAGRRSVVRSDTVDVGSAAVERPVLGGAPAADPGLYCEFLDISVR